MSMRIRVNGDETEVAADASVRSLLVSLELDREGVAVAVDLVVVPRSQWDRRGLREGEAVEVICAVGGG